MSRESLSKGKKFDILSRDNFTCVYCGRSAPAVKLEVDHLIPVAKGGTNEHSNLVTACEDCNRGKRDKILNAYCGTPIGRALIRAYGLEEKISPALYFLPAPVGDVIREYGGKL